MLIILYMGNNLKSKLPSNGQDTILKQCVYVDVGNDGRENAWGSITDVIVRETTAGRDTGQGRWPLRWVSLRTPINYTSVLF